MSRKYIRQQILQDFVYPNNDVAQYDIEIVQDINNNCVDGNITSFSATTFNATGVTFSINASYILDGAEPFNLQSGQRSVLSVHMMAEGQDYFKPWRLVKNYTGSTASTGTTIVDTFTVLPSQLGLASFSAGVYYFEFRFIGHKCVLPICYTLNLAAPTPTPTPTNTGTPTPTPTGTPTNTPTNTPTPTVVLQSYQATLCGGEGTYNFNYSATTLTVGQVVQEGPTCFTITSILPYTGGLGGIIGVFTSCEECQGITPTPTPTPTGTPTSTPTPTPTSSGLTTYGDCGYGNSVASACNDAGINARTLYSNCDAGSFGVGCFVYVDTFPNALTGYTNVFMNGACWDINSSTGVVTAYSSVQC